MDDSQTDIAVAEQVELKNFLPEIGIDKLGDEIVLGLKADQKYISPKFFYDNYGSELFEQITELEEYYPTRTEKSIISTVVKDLDINFTNLNIVELGSGDASKISLFLKQIPKEQLKTITYSPVDISPTAIEKSSQKLLSAFPLKKITGLVIDFFHQLDLVPKQGQRLFCFFGSTIGNFNSDEAQKFIKTLSNNMQTGDHLLLGMDMVKDTDLIEVAYNDQKGITAAFNLNILSAVNKITNSNFKTADFEHYAYFNTKFNRIEMHLRANKDVIISLANQQETIGIKKGETIHTENSHKFTAERIHEFAEIAKFDVEGIFADPKQWFSLVHYIKKTEGK